MHSCDATESEGSWEVAVRKPLSASRGTMLFDLDLDDLEYINVSEQMQGTVREHKDSAGGVFSRYNIVKVCVYMQSCVYVCIYVYVSFSSVCLNSSVLYSSTLDQPLTWRIAFRLWNCTHCIELSKLLRCGCCIDSG